MAVKGVCMCGSKARKTVKEEEEVLITGGSEYLRDERKVDATV